LTDRDSEKKSFAQKDESSSNKTKDDSMTRDVSLFRRIRKHDDRVTIRINKQFKEAIKRHVKAKGLSICHINDALWFGYLLGWNEKLDLDVKSPTINLTLVRDVKRVRRYAVEEDGGKCVYCGKVAIGEFRYKKTGGVYPLCGFHAKENLASKIWERALKI